MSRVVPSPGPPTPLDPTEAAWGEFHGRLRAFVAQRLRNPDDAEDIVQQVFLRLHRGRGAIRNEQSVGAWLYRTARNAIADEYRRPAWRRETSAGDTRELDGRESPPEDEATGVACAEQCLRPPIDQLPEADRRAIVSVELEGMTQLDAAALEGLSHSGMKARVQRARHKLKRMLLECCQVALDARGSPAGCETQPGGPGSPRCG